MNQPILNTAYQFARSPLGLIPLAPIIAKRDPTTADAGGLGQEWINVSSGNLFFMTKVANALYTWTPAAVGTGAFNAITATLGPNSIQGTTAINTTSTAATTIGNTTGALSLTTGAGALTVTSGAGGASFIGGGGTIGLYNDAAANLITLGSITGAASLTLRAGTGGIALNAAGNVSMQQNTTGSPVASPTAAVTNNNRVGLCVFTGFTTAAAAKQAFVITNSTITTSSAIRVSVSNVRNVNDAQMQLASVVIASAGGSMTVNTTNVGAAALDGNILISWWVQN